MDHLPGSYPIGTYEPDANTIVIFYEQLKPKYPNATNLSKAIQRTLLHEIGHALTLDGNYDFNASEGVMLEIEVDLHYPDYQKFLLADIKRIQEKSKVATSDADYE